MLADNHFKSCFIYSGKKKVHYIDGRHNDYQSKSTIVFLHGFPECSYAWLEYLSFFHSLEFNVVAPDLRGNFLSNGFDSKHEYEFSKIVNDIEEIIKPYTTNKLIVVGHDLGGVIAWLLAERLPSVISGAIIMSCPHPNAFAQIVKKHILISIRQMFRFWYISFFQIPRIPEWYLSHKINKILKTLFSKNNGLEIDCVINKLQFYNKTLNSSKAIRKAIYPYRANLFSRYGISIIKLILKKNKPKTITLPILMCSGKQDPVLENSLFQKNKYNHLSSLTHLNLDAGKHYIQYQYYDLIKQEIVDWCEINDFIDHILTRDVDIEKKNLSELYLLYDVLLKEYINDSDN